MADFKRLEVWRRAQALAIAVYRMTSTFPPDQRFGLREQMQRSAVSICSNIAEGCGRGGDAELRRFLRIARGSTNELECQLLLAKEFGFLAETEWNEVDSSVQVISAGLHALIQSLA